VITTRTHPSGGYQSATTPRHDPDHMDRPVPVWSLLARLGHRPNPVSHQRPECFCYRCIPGVV
jgi:hypothetical protein